MSDRQLLVAIHDVTPAHARHLETVFALLDQHAVPRYALFVVPDWHGRWPLEADDAFVAKLRERRRAGAEVFLHGLRHDEVGTRRSPLQHLRAWGRTAREAEFMSLSRVEAARRVDSGLETLRRAGLDPVGFVAPAWLAGEGLSSVLMGRGLTITEDAFWVRDLAGDRRLRAPALQWSTRARWRATAGVGIAAARQRLERRRPLLRLAIHPPDVGVPAVERSLRRALRFLLENRRALSYQEALGRE
jgi:uncharacterized protein